MKSKQVVGITPDGLTEYIGTICIVHEYFHEKFLLYVCTLCIELIFNMKGQIKCTRIHL